MNARSVELGERSTNVRTPTYTSAAKMPESTGEKTHERTIDATPLTNGNSDDGAFHTTQSEPTATSDMPMSAPITECVVETGSSK